MCTSSTSRNGAAAAIAAPATFLFLFAASLLQILACVLYSNWWPMLTGVAYIVIPIPCLFVERSTEFISSADAGDWADAAKFVTGLSGVGSIAIPSILCHTGLIQVGSMCMVFASTFSLICAAVLFYKFKSEDDS